MKSLTRNYIIAAVVAVLLIGGGGYAFYSHSVSKERSYGGGYLYGASYKAMFTQQRVKIDESFTNGFNDGKNEKQMLYEDVYQDIFNKKSRTFSENGTASKDLGADEEKVVSYVIGYETGKGFSKYLASVNYFRNKDQFYEAYFDGLEGRESRLEEETLNKVRNYLEEESLKERKKQELDAFKKQKEQESKVDALYNDNQEKGKKFLAENAIKEGVKTTETGLQYRILKEGNGKKPSSKSTVTVHYKGSLIDGTEFDSSYQRGEPATFPLQGVILGWQEGIPLMREGAKYQFFIPSSLAYGKDSQHEKIPPGSVLVFEVDLLKVR